MILHTINSHLVPSAFLQFFGFNKDVIAETPFLSSHMTLTASSCAFVCILKMQIRTKRKLQLPKMTYS